MSSINSTGINNPVIDISTAQHQGSNIDPETLNKFQEAMDAINSGNGQYGHAILDQQTKTPDKPSAMDIMQGIANAQRDGIGISE